MACMVLCRTFHTAPEQEQGQTFIVPHYSGSGPGTGHSQCNYIITLFGKLRKYLNSFRLSDNSDRSFTVAV